MRFLQILANQCQTGLVAQVVGQLFDDEIGHGLFTCWVKQHIGSKPLISIENLGFFDCQVTDPGNSPETAYNKPVLREKGMQSE
jgi:hypothetical protein